MFKKLLLLIIGGGAAAGGFMYYISLPEDESAALVRSISEQKVNLQNIASDIAESGVIQKAISKGKENLMESPQAQEWLAKMVQGYANEHKQAKLSEEASEEVVDILVKVREFSEKAHKEQATGAEPFNAEHQRQFAQIMEQGDQVLQRHLGITLTEFLTKINKSSFQQTVIE